MGNYILQFEPNIHSTYFGISLLHCKALEFHWFFDIQ